ncbi:MAG: capsule biosynthesis protein [Gammaproteobacteria bacterium]|nr:capsule biosynthesis protein [Gammaproteobacteria bacterium]
MSSLSLGRLRGLLKTSRLGRPLRLARMAMRARFGGLPNWRRILGDDWPEWQRRLADDQPRPRVLIATGVGGHLPVNTLDSALAVALVARGASVEVLLCDAALPACMLCEVGLYPNRDRFVRDGPRGDLCRHCYAPAARMYRGLGIEVRTYGALVTEDARQQAQSTAQAIELQRIPGFTDGEVAVGEHSRAGALRFFARGDLGGEPQGEAVLRRYFQAGLLATAAVRRLLAERDYACVVTHHGIYVPQGIVAGVARERGVRVVTWNPAYRKRCFIFSHRETYHQSLMTEPVSHWEGLPWGEAQEQGTLEYLKSRWTGSQDWIWFHEAPTFDLSRLERETGIDGSRPTIGLLTNVVWDSQLHYPANAFPDMTAWLVRTVKYFASRPDLQLLIRVHPAEIHGDPPSRQRVVEELAKRFGTLPRNVFVIPPESRVSTYAAMSRCNAVIIYGTKTGVELASMGIPVIVAGEAWIRNKGISADARDEADYLRMLDSLPLAARMPGEQVERARKYAFHFFFRRMIPLEVMQPTGRWPPYRVAARGLGPLEPGRSAGLDVICDGILHGREFVFPAEGQVDGPRH